MEEKTPTTGLLSALDGLVRASERGDFSVAINNEGLTDDEKKAVMLIDEVVRNYNAAIEYDMMKYRLTSDALNVALWDMDVVSADPVNPVNKITYSMEFRYLLGFNDENDFPNVLRSWSDRLHPEDREETLAAFAAHMNDYTGATPFDVEYRLLMRSGEYRYFHAFGTTFRDKAGVPIKVAGALRDIEDRKQAEKQQMIMQSIVHNSPSFVAYKKLGGECLYVNPSASRITGYSQEELMEDYVGILLDAETARHFSEIVTQDLREKGLSVCEIKGRFKNGEPRTFSTTSFMIEKDAFATIGADVTEKKQLEEEREMSLKLLKKTTEQLKAALLETQDANRVKDEFLSRMSHEMLTPMNAIMGMAQIIRNSGISDESKEYVDEIEAASKNLMGLINDLLDVSGQRDGEFMLEDSVFSFEEMIWGILDDLRRDIIEKRQKFKHEIDPAVPDSLIGDEKHLARVISNLLSNAVKFTPENGEISLCANVIDETDGVIALCVEVADNGIGIPIEQQDAIFDVFEQVDGSLTRKHGGIGVGLSLSEQIIKQMGGSIKVASEPGKGTTFTFTCKLRRHE